MQNDFNAPIEYDTHRKGYYYTDTSYRLPAMLAGKDTAQLMELVMLSSASLQGTSLYNAAAGEIEKITAPVANPVTYNSSEVSIHRPCQGSTQPPNIDWIKRRVVFLKNNAAEFSAADWDAVYHALEANREICFLYKGRRDKGYNMRHARPYQLLFDTYLARGWTLWAYDTDKRDGRMFLLSRMKDVEIGDAHFTLPRDYEYQKIGDGVFGAYYNAHGLIRPSGLLTNHEAARFSVLFKGDAVHDLEGKTWGREQRIEYTEAGAVLSFMGTQYSEVLRWVLSFGAEAVPLSPQWLAEEWRRQVREMGKAAKE